MLAGSHAIQMSDTADVPFAYASARVRMLEQRMLSRGDVERLLTAPSVQAGMRVLADTEYASAIAILEHGDGGDYELVLAAELQRVYELVVSFAPHPELLAMWAARHAFLALKMLLKAGLRQDEIVDDQLPLWMPVERSWLRDIVGQVVGQIMGEEADAGDSGDNKSEDADGLEGFLFQAARDAAKTYHRHRAPEEIDHAVDGLYQRYLLKLTDQRQSAFLRGWVVRFGDVTNLKTFVRFAVAGRTEASLSRALLAGGSLSVEQFMGAYASDATADERIEFLSEMIVGTQYEPVLAEGWQAYQKEGLLYGMEQLADRFLERYLDTARFQPFGLGVVWAYVMAKEREARLVRLIFVGKSAGLSEKQLRERIDYV